MFWYWCRMILILILEWRRKIFFSHFTELATFWCDCVLVLSNCEVEQLIFFFFYVLILPNGNSITVWKMRILKICRLFKKLWYPSKYVENVIIWCFLEKSSYCRTKIVASFLTSLFVGTLKTCIFSFSSFHYYWYELQIEIAMARRNVWCWFDLVLMFTKS